MFQEDKYYSRNDIHAQLGGGLQDYLPHKDGRIVCACLRPDTNPDAPDILLVGSGSAIYRWACVFCNQKIPVPTFVKARPNSWRYVGVYFAEAWTENRVEIAIHSQRAQRTDIRRIVFLMKFADPRFQIRR
jgi:hypothetical protein